MNKIKFIAGALGVLAILLGAVAFAQTTTTSATSTPPQPAPVAPMPPLFQEMRGDVGSVNLSTALITVTVYNDCKAGPNQACAAWYSMEKTLTMGEALVLGPNDQALRSVGEVHVGDKVRLYVRTSNNTVLAMKIVSPIKDEPRLCTMEAKQCPDGSYVGRTGPKCEFAACPISTGTSTPATMCGGIAGLKCPSGYSCKMSGNYPDASGVCVSSNQGPSLQGKRICITRTMDGISTEDCKTIPPGVLRQGMKSDQVRHLQERLIKEGFLTQDSATGFFGNMTLSAIKQFQKAKDLPSTGYVGAMTLQKMEEEND